MGGLRLHYDGSDTSESDEMDDNIPSINGGPPPTVNTTNGTTRHQYVEEDDADVQALLKQWKRTFPNKLKPNELSVPDLVTFMGRALSLINCGEEHMETVILALTSDGGQARVRQVTDRNFDNLTGVALQGLWRHLLLVYFKIVSHDTVLESQAVDRRLASLMSDLYGEQGKRASSVFRAALHSLLGENKQQDITARSTQEHVETCIAVLACVFSLSDLSVTAELRAVTEAIVALSGTPHISNKTGMRILSIRGVLDRALIAQNSTPSRPLDIEDATAPAEYAAPPPTARASPPAPPPVPEASRGPAQSSFTLRKPTAKKQGMSTIRRLKAAPETTLTAPPPVSTPAAPLQVPSAVVEDHTAGHLRPKFDRHDNDKEHINKIRIMPTLAEILSDAMPYLPREDPSTWHRSGLPGVVDRHFRLVREDTVGQLRISVKAELAALQNTGPAPKPTSSFAHSMSEIQGARTNVYSDVALEKVLFDAQKGVQFLLTIPQPPSASRLRNVQDRDAWWKREQSLGPNSLLCLISSNGGAHFLVVYNPPPPKPGKPHNPNAFHKRFSLGAQKERAYVIAELATTHPDDATALLRTLAATSTTTKVRRSLIEFPGQILPSFAPTLAALQIMSTNIRDIPFPNALTPDFKNFTPSSPAYSRRPGFQYQLQALLPESERRRPGRQNVDSILKRSVLDDVQQDAVKHALTNELALIQGPPGTGKSFTGVKLIEALLENRRNGNLGPIVCVCFTNHALDQLLEHLMDAGVQGVIRMGSRSKSERLAPVNIREVARNYAFEGNEGARLGRARKAIKKTTHNIFALLTRWNGMLDQKHVEEAEITTMLARDHAVLHAQLLGGHTERGHFARTPIQAWLQGGLDLRSSRAETNGHGPGRGAMSTMSHEERQKFYRKLLDKIFEEIYDELDFELQSFYDRKGIIDVVRGDLDLRALSNADVIGVTTSGLAGKYKRLRKLNTKVVVVEEAGEVLEAHLLTAMLPSVEHAILIGDHQQLRPKVNNYDLSIDNPCSRITLDVSLFERLVSHRYDLSPGLPFVTLEMQRRMHPSISNLIRSTLYPNLGDAPNVKSYPPVAGMAKRLFWLDHRNKEDDSRNNPQSVSQSNKWEVSMVAALVAHLQKQGVYGPGDIAVLTPYSGQVKEFQAKFRGTCGIMLSERDLDDGILADGNVGRSRNAIRLSTVDAFQGEEAKVIIISLVRSNDKKMCGFLGTTNRINVLLSRAMHGMYVIGNSNTTSEISMWQSVVSLFKADGNFGPALEIACARHPNSAAPLLVREPRDFQRVSPAAGCNAECGEQLACGHLCSEKCHSEAMHNQVKCKQRCDGPMEGCKHRCPEPCSEVCELNRKAMVPCDLSLPCGHHLTEIQCFQKDRKTSHVRCKVEVEQVVPGCGHTTVLPCYVHIGHPKYQCEEACAAALSCGHLCGKDCADCQPRGQGGKIGTVDHGRCVEKCGRNLPDCSHKCSKPCHGEDSPCPPCTAPCQSDCAHLKCKKACNEPCPPCTNEKCPSGCPHSKCEMPCAAPCDLIPCSKRCKEKLKCGHQCPSLCGETCPTVEFCQRCAKDAVKSIVVDPVTKESYEDVEQQCLFLSCGHIFTVQALDRHMDMETYYEMDDYRGTSFPVALRNYVPGSYEKPKGCPTCGGSLRTISRYGRIMRRALLDGKANKFVASFNQVYAPLATQLRGFEKNLPKGIDKARLSGDITLNMETSASAPKGLASNSYQSVLASTGPRYVAPLKLRLEIRALLEKTRHEEMPFQKVREMIETAERRKRPEFYVDQILPRTCNLLAMQTLLLRCELAIATDLVALWQTRRVTQQTKLTTNFAKNRKECDALLTSAIEANDISRQTEAHVFWAQFLALDCATRSHDVEL